MAPFDLASSLNAFSYALVFSVLGIGFGAVLEMAGFGDSRKLAAQFYFRDMTVLKVMFTAIVVACVLVYLASAFELLDFSRIWVNPTYLASGIVGGLIMGVGFIVGGFCPGTSLVAAATLKIDGLFFVLGAFFGVYLFGESVARFEPFFLSTYLGRFTLPDWLGLPAGVVVLLLALVALGMFWGAEIAEAYFGEKRPWSHIRLIPYKPRKLFAALVLLIGCVALIAKGQPTPEQRWRQIAASADKLLRNRSIFVHPAEVVELKSDTALAIRIFDLRDERDFNLFHIGDSERVSGSEIADPAFIKRLLDFPDNAISFLVSNGEQRALGAWKTLKAQGVINLYIIEGGINRWLELYPLPQCVASKRDTRNKSAADERIGYRFNLAVGSRAGAAYPELEIGKWPDPCLSSDRQTRAETGESAVQEKTKTKYHYIKKVVLQRKRAVKGGCG
ncbi:MAG: YeeE/YedE family protein [Deltaproteobacteria bacterium]|nr:YeeE/YedE family protein [Deltaproteobacteria bacterium]